jgi:phi13 family phage major tail protein
MEAGKVITGYSLPYVAIYTVTEGVVAYSSGQQLARGVSVEASPESSDSNNFYVNNIIGESLAGAFTGGQVTLTVDGLLQASEKLIQGLPTADEDGLIHYNDDQQKPFCGIGFIVRYMSGGVTYYTPVIFPKGTFNQIEMSAETQGEEVDFQTQELVFNIMKDDTIKHDWKILGGELATEAAAEAIIKDFLNVA